MQEWGRQEKTALDAWITREPDYPDLEDKADIDPYTGARDPDEDACHDGCEHGTSDDDPAEYEAGRGRGAAFLARPPQWGL